MHKSVNAVTRQFCARLHKLIRDYWQPTPDLDPNIDLNAELRALVEYHVSAAYFEGLQEGGISPEEFDEDMSAQADDLIAQQFEYVTDFVHAIEDALSDVNKRDNVMARADVWCNSIYAAGQAGLTSAAKNEMVRWVLGNTEEHCDTCLWLDGQTHRRSWFARRNYVPRQPGAAMDCGGYHCDCDLVPAKR